MLLFELCRNFGLGKTAIVLSSCARSQQKNGYLDHTSGGCEPSEDRISSQSMYNPE